MASMLLMGVLATGFVLAFVLALIWLIGRVFPYERNREAEDVRATLRRRYDSGAISADEYAQALRALEIDERLLV